MKTAFKFKERRLVKTKNRCGQSLVLMIFAMIVLAGILALSLDYGFVLLARRQMQTGVNAAALEGSRNINGQGRQSAQTLIRNVYDDDFDPAENLTTLGAGIDRSIVQGDGFQSVTLGNGDGVVSTLANRSSFIYRPNPELNLDNEAHGDFVRGDYSMDQSHAERSDYDRDDFVPDPAGTAFLARVRRTHDPNGLDEQAGVSSRGGGMPLLVGHLAWFSATDPNADFSIRRDGVSVRATAIADHQVAVQVGTSNDARVLGTTPFAISSQDLVAGNLSEIQSVGSAHTTVGQTLSALGPTSQPTTAGYIAVYKSCLLYTSPSPRDATLSRMPSSA